MMLRALEAEALYEGYAQKGFGVLSLDRSPVPLGSTATSEPIEIPRSLWGRWKSLDDHRDAITSLWIKKTATQTKEYQWQSMTIEGQAEQSRAEIRYDPGCGRVDILVMVWAPR
jgi:hypothetical protein